MLFSKVEGQSVGKVFESKEDAVKFYGEEKNIFPVLYPTEWLEASDKKLTSRVDNKTFINIDGNLSQCHIMGIDVSYPQK
jgi:hypothetical protein